MASRQATQCGILAAVQGFGSALQLILARHDGALQALPSTMARPAGLQLRSEPGGDLSLIEAWSSTSPGMTPLCVLPNLLLVELYVGWTSARMCHEQRPVAAGCAGGGVHSDAAPGAAGIGRPLLQRRRHERCLNQLQFSHLLRSQHSRIPYSIATTPCQCSVGCSLLHLYQRAVQQASCCGVLSSFALQPLQAAAWS